MAEPVSDRLDESTADSDISEFPWTLYKAHGTGSALVSKQKHNPTGA